MTEQEKKMWQDDLDMIDMLNERNKDLEGRINKVIEYINSQSPDAGVSGHYIKKILEGNNENIKR